jgi:Asp/Glu/hydantoin racemase
MTKLALIHTVGSLPPVFAALARESLPGIETTDTVDEALLGETIAAGRIPQATADRLAAHVDAALREGADLVLVTCSSMGPAVDALAGRGLPVLRVDEALADAAIRAGTRIGVIATLSTTLEPTAALIRRRATVLGREERRIDIMTDVVDGAFAELKAGRLDRHDELVRAGLRRLIPKVDVIVLAQASMARVAATLAPGEAQGRPILASPALGIERAAERLGVGPAVAG